MKLTLALPLAAICLLALVPLVQASTTTNSSSASSGYVVYNVQASYNGTTRAASVNESVTPSSTTGESIIGLAVVGTQTNFTYSRVVNSSLTIFPFLPGISSQNFTYSDKGYTVTAKISQQGTSQATFQGKAYTLTNYAFSADRHLVQRDQDHNRHHLRVPVGPGLLRDRPVQRLQRLRDPDGDVPRADHRGRGSRAPGGLRGRRALPRGWRGGALAGG